MASREARRPVCGAKAAGCKRLAEERASGGRWDRPELHRLLGELEEGDIVVVRKLDRLMRSLKDLLLILEKIEAAGAGFCSLTEAIGTTTTAGRMMMRMLGSFAEFERAHGTGTHHGGASSGQERGRKGGRRPKLTSDQRSEIIGMLNDGPPAAEIARIFRVHRATVRRIGAQTKMNVR
ncbi:recombinase family protein [Mesorhizobium sp. C420B]|uniref:recombinase family protein n=1 Tax=unclassified Mesorhizobium TaxID=325217 RepID=UPI0004CE7CF1|nr:recombinase family protein [Mesorhizobium sp. LSHC420B00]